MFNLNNIFEKRKTENKEINIDNSSDLNPSSLLNMAHYEELYMKLAEDNNEMGVVKDIISAKNTAMELCKKDPAMVKAWKDEKDPVLKEGILQSMLLGINKDQN